MQINPILDRPFAPGAAGSAAGLSTENVSTLPVLNDLLAAPLARAGLPEPALQVRALLHARDARLPAFAAFRRRRVPSRGRLGALAPAAAAAPAAEGAAAVGGAVGAR